MKYALVEDIRSKPKPRNKGKCPVCGGEVISKCGKKIIWHWAHTPSKHCDPWWENETQWHRDWKSNFPEKWQEIIHFDSITGEKHIADVKTDSGKVIEFQNSPIESQELERRETFYKNIIWVLNGEGFKNNFHILDKLPGSKSYLLEDIVFHPRKHNHHGKLFHKRSENPDNPTMVRIHSINDIQEEIDKEYRGHHLYDWVRPRSVWFESNVSVYIDFGEQFLWNLQTLGSQNLRCVQAVNKQRFIEENGGSIKS